MVANDSVFDMRYSDTTPINPLFRDFLDTPLPGSTTPDHKPNAHETPENIYLIQPSTNIIKDFSGNRMTDLWRPSLHENLEEVTPKMNINPKCFPPNTTGKRKQKRSKTLLNINLKSSTTR